MYHCAIVCMIQAAKNVKVATVVNQTGEKEVQEEGMELEEIEKEGQDTEESSHCSEVKEISTAVVEDSSTAAGELDTVGETAAPAEVIAESNRRSSVGESDITTAPLPKSVDGDAAVGESRNSDAAVDQLSTTVCEPADGRADSLGTAVAEEDQQDLEDEDIVLLSRDSRALQGLCYSRMKLLLYRGSFFLAGAVLLLGGGVASIYHPQGELYDLTNCTNVTAWSMTTGNMTAGNITMNQ